MSSQNRGKGSSYPEDQDKNIFGYDSEYFDDEYYKSSDKKIARSNKRRHREHLKDDFELTDY